MTNKTLRSDKIFVACHYHSVFESDKWIKEIPVIKFPRSWSVKIIPPFGGAVVRFLITKSEDAKNRVSVYLDCYDMLGFWGKPYWEVYPSYNNDTFRCDMLDTKKLIDAISAGLKQL